MGLVLRQRMLEDMQLRNFSAGTQRSYIHYVADFATYYHTSPDRMGLKVPVQIPVVLSEAEIQAFFRHIGIPQYRAVLMVCYGSGLRISEAVSLKINDIDSERMLIRVEHGKGGKDRYTLLGVRLLAVLRAYWKTHRSSYWLFPGFQRGTHVQPATIRQACREAAQKAGFIKRVTPHTLRHASAYCTTFQSPFILKAIRLVRARSAGVYGRRGEPPSPEPALPAAANQFS
jgi:integrase/recombinase XerD